ncbi:MAG: hypothetical protein K8L97_00145 [Anaerolineae bacterium]|nr:hypothetical protein [Anaerolineae bacterium]
MTNKWLFGLCLFAFLYAVHPLSAADCAIEQLTEGATYGTPQLDNHWLMWSGYEETQGAVITPLWLYDLNADDEARRLTEELTIHTFPQISGNAVIWLSGEDLERELFLYEIDTAQTTQLTTNQLYESDPQIHNGQVVWAADETGEGVLYTGEIFLYDHAAGTITQITDTNEGNFSPQIYNGRIVWVGTEMGQPYIMLYDGGIITQISDDASISSNPQINDRWIVWMAETDGNPDRIMLYDLESRAITQLGEGVRFPPDLSAEGMVWATHDGDNRDIFWYDGDTIHPITADDEDDSAPSLSGDEIVWSRSVDGETNIFHYQISTATLSQLTTTDYNYTPTIEDGNVVWTGNADIHGGDIFLYRCR